MVIVLSNQLKVSIIILARPKFLSNMNSETRARMLITPGNKVEVSRIGDQG